MPSQTPRPAIGLAAVCNLQVALGGTAAAWTNSGGLVEANSVTILTVLCALIGGLCGAALATAGDRHALIWSALDAKCAAIGL